MVIAADIDWSVLEKLSELSRFDIRKDRGEWSLYCNTLERWHRIDFSSCIDAGILEECCYDVLAETGRDIELRRSPEGFWNACLINSSICTETSYKSRLEAIIQLICKLKEIE